MKRVLILFPVETAYKKYFDALNGEYDFLFGEDELSQEELESVHIILGQPTIEQILMAKQLEWIQFTFAGVDSYLKTKQIPEYIMLTNSTGAFGHSISEYMLTMVLSLYKNMPHYQKQQKEEIWKDFGREYSLKGKTVLIVGAGDIGCHFAKLLSAFSVKTMGIRRVARALPPYFTSMHGMEELDDLLPMADIVSLSLPSTDDTRGIMNEKRLRLMKKNAVLLNVGRGDAIVTEDLVKVLKSGHLFGAALDVTDPEPLPKGHPLWQMEQVLLTPHITGMSIGHLEETYEAILDLCVQNLMRYQKGEPLINQVDKETGYRKL